MQPINIAEPALLIRIAKLYHERMTPDGLYEATRGVWRLGQNRDAVELALSISGGIVREVFTVNQWHPAATTPYYTRPLKDVQVSGRWEFSGTVAPENVRSKYVGRSVTHYFSPGASNPVLYVNV